MAHDHLESLRKQVGYAEWRDQPPDDEDVFVVQLGLTGDEISEWQLDHVHSVSDPESGRTVYSTWITAEDPALGVRIDANLRHSRTEARDQLLERLASVQLPQVQRLTAGTVGDVGFALGDNNLVLFSRGNVVVEVATLGSTDIDVLAVARQFDDHLVAHPGAESTGTKSARARRGAAGEGALTEMLESCAPGERTALPVPPSVREALDERRSHDELGLPRFVPIAPPEPSPGDKDALRRRGSTIKVFVRNGEISDEDGRLWFTAADAGERTIEVYDDDPGPVNADRSVPSGDD